jgi:hypothetical protein
MCYGYFKFVKNNIGMPKQYSHDFMFERDFPENVKTIFFNGKTYSKEKFNSEMAKSLKRKSSKQLKVVY